MFCSKGKTFFRFTGLALLLIIFWGLDVLAQSPTTCATCSENYYTCQLGIPQCVENKIRQCRINGGDESQCENGRPHHEEECSQNCRQEYESCLVFCSPRGSYPPTGGFPSNCSVPSGNFTLDDVGLITASAYSDPYRDHPIVFYIDGFQESPTGYAHLNTYTLDIPRQWRNGEEHILEVYATNFCNSRYYYEFLGSETFQFLPSFSLWTKPKTLFDNQFLFPVKTEMRVANLGKVKEFKTNNTLSK